MSTRSKIAILNSNKTVEVIYAHWDGYPSHNGKILLEHYADTKKVRELLKCGNVSSLGANIGTKHDFDNAPKFECNFYGRDRGEDGQESKHFQSLEQYRRTIGDSWAEYVYVWDVEHHKWLYNGTTEFENTSNLKTLTAKSCKRN